MKYYRLKPPPSERAPHRQACRRLSELRRLHSAERRVFLPCSLLSFSCFFLSPFTSASSPSSPPPAEDVTSSSSSSSSYPTARLLNSRASSPLVGSDVEVPPPPPAGGLLDPLATELDMPVAARASSSSPLSLRLSNSLSSASLRSRCSAASAVIAWSSPSPWSRTSQPVRP